MLLLFRVILIAFRRSSVGMSNYSATIRSVPRFIRPADDSFICISASSEGRVEADLTKDRWWPGSSISRLPPGEGQLYGTVPTYVGRHIKEDWGIIVKYIFKKIFE
jgi:hypothetical protein